MKKYLSVFMLIARCSIYKVFGLLILMAGCEFLAFSCKLSAGKGDLYVLEDVFSGGFCDLIFFICAAVLLFLLSRMGTFKGVKTMYTLSRLSVSKKCVFWIESLYDTLCFIILWLFQVVLAVGLCYYYIHAAGSESATEQTIFLAFFRNVFLHSLLPFDEPFSLICNLLLALVIGITIAQIPWSERSNKMSFFTLYIIFVVHNIFLREAGDLWQPAIICIAAVIVIANAIYFTFKKEAADEN